MNQDYLESLKTELWDFKQEVLGDEVIRQLVREVIIEEIKLAEQIATQIAADERLAQLGLGPGDILPKVDDMLSRLLDWWRKRRKKVD